MVGGMTGGFVVNDPANVAADGKAEPTPLAPSPEHSQTPDGEEAYAR
jgi:hypothetical protein